MLCTRIKSVSQHKHSPFAVDGCAINRPFFKIDEYSLRVLYCKGIKFSNQQLYQLLTGDRSSRTVGKSILLLDEEVVCNMLLRIP